LVTRSLVVRLDNLGDVLLAGPAVRAVAAGSDRVTMLVGPNGDAAARLLPGVDEVIVWRCPWIDPHPDRIDANDVHTLVERLAAEHFDVAVICTSFHQSPLPTALVLRLAGIGRLAAISTDYPGSLLDVRHHVDDDLPEPERALSLVEAAGFALPAGDPGRLEVRRRLPDVTALIPNGDYVVLHPGTSVPARAWPVERFKETARLLASHGYRVVVTGARSEQALTAEVALAGDAVDLGGRTSLPELAAIVDWASAVVVANTGPAHLAAAVGTPVVSLFAPTVPAARWAPYRVPTVLLGDQHAACRNTRATRCPIEGHPCLASVGAHDVLGAIRELDVRHQALAAQGSAT
jgi:ADP-heptose:LPS heptosyltransferase